MKTKPLSENVSRSATSATSRRRRTALFPAALVALASLLLLATSRAAINAVPNRAALAATRTLDWQVMGTLGVNVGAHEAVGVAGFGLMDVSCASGVIAQIRQSTAGGLGDWHGNFTPGDPGCYTTGAPLTLSFRGKLVRALGFNIQSWATSYFTARLRYYRGIDGTGALLATHSVGGISNGTNNGSAVFLGGVSDGAASDFGSVVIDLTAATSAMAQLAINNVSFTELSAPVFTAPVANSPTGGAATFSTVVSVGDRPASISFDYGPSPALGNSAPVTPASIAGGSASVSATLTGLTPMQVIHYRFTAANDGATASVASSIHHGGPGTLDTTFSGNGMAVTPYMDGTTLRASQGHAVAMQADGKIVVAGERDAGGQSNFAVARYLADGTLDASFGAGGWVSTQLSAQDDYALAAAIQPDGKILAAGALTTAGTSDAVVVRYLTSGALDTTFGTNGIVVIPFNLGGTNHDYAEAIAVQSDGRIVLAGTANNAGGSDIAVVRLTSAGVLDVTFDGDGKLTTGIGTTDAGAAVAIQSDGKIVVAGSTPVAYHDFVVLRYLSNGAADGAFGSGGRTIVSIGDHEASRDVLLQPDGRIVVAGFSSNGTTYGFAALRLNANGTLDTSFDGDGKLVTYFTASNSGLHTYGFGGVLQPDGKLVMVGQMADGSYYDMAVARYNPDGTLDATFDGDGKLTLAPGPRRDRLDRVTLTPAGGIVATGFSDDASGVSQLAVVKLVGGPNELLVNGSFEANEALGGGISTAFGDWKHDLASTVGAENGITPYHGVRMARFRGTTDSGHQAGNPDGDLSQYVDLSAYAAAIDAGAVQVTVTARFNRIPGPAPVVDTEFNLRLIAGAWTPLSTVPLPQLGQQTSTLLSDGLTTTWEPLTNTWTLPVGTRHLLVNPYARENILDGGAFPEFDGHYVDGVTLALTIQPEIQIESPAGTPLTDGNSTIDFGATPLGTQVTRTFIVRNLGNTGALNLSGITLPAGYELVVPFTPVAIPGGGSHSFDARFLAHTVSGVFSGTMTLLSDDGDEGSFDIALAARAIIGGNQSALDTSFSFDGLLTTDFTNGNEWANDLVIQPDGKIIAVGLANDSLFGGGTSDFAMARYSADGSLDVSFGVSGRVLTPVWTGNDTARAVALQPDGKIIVAGDVENGARSSFAVVRHLADGSLDGAFGSGGKTITAISNSIDRANAMALQSDGRILLGGESRNSGGDYRFTMARYLPDGSLDATFGGGGLVITAVVTGASTIASLAVQSDGRIVAVGHAWNGSDYDAVVVRYLANGALDSSFATGGKVILPIGSGWDLASAVAIQPDGRILIAGAVSSAGNYDILLARFLSNGALDSTFGAAGIVTVPSASDDDANDVALTGDGRIVTVGSRGSGSIRDFLVARFTSQGMLDTSFGTGGVTTTAVGSGQDIAYAVALQPDGRIVAAGMAVVAGNNRFALARYGADLMPTVTTFPASAVTASGAQLTGSVNAHGVTTTAWFQWGSTPSYGQTTTAAAIGYGTSAINLTDSLSALTPNTTYYFRIVAQNGARTAFGAGMSFTTLTPIQAWRQTYFGATANSGNAANSADPDLDGVLNLSEFAFGTNPTVSSSGAIVVSGASIVQRGSPTVWLQNTTYGVDYRALFGRRVDYLAAGLTYTVEFSADMSPGSWEPSAATPTVLASDGEIEAVTVPYPFFLSTGAKAQFFRVVVTAP